MWKGTAGLRAVCWHGFVRAWCVAGWQGMYGGPRMCCKGNGTAGFGKVWQGKVDNAAIVEEFVCQCITFSMA